MKKLFVGILVAASMLSINAYGDNKTFVSISSLAGLSHIVGDGRYSFGIHFDRGSYNFNGHRYSSRSAYLQAVASFERQRQFSQKQSNSRVLERRPVISISTSSFGSRTSSLRTNSLRTSNFGRNAICY